MVSSFTCSNGTVINFPSNKMRMEITNAHRQEWQQQKQESAFDVLKENVKKIKTKLVIQKKEKQAMLSILSMLILMLTYPTIKRQVF